MIAHTITYISLINNPEFYMIFYKMVEGSFVQFFLFYLWGRTLSNVTIDNLYIEYTHILYWKFKHLYLKSKVIKMFRFRHWWFYLNRHFRRKTEKKQGEKEQRRERREGGAATTPFNIKFKRTPFRPRNIYFIRENTPE